MRSKDKFTLIWTPTFVRTARKFIKRHPPLKGMFEDVIKYLEENPFTSRLRLHPLKGRRAGKHAVSITYDYRIVLILKITRKEIILLDIGTHDEVYRDAGK